MNHRIAVLIFAVLAPALCFAQPRSESATETDDAQAKARIERAVQSIVKIDVRSVPKARSSATLGEVREGNGVLIEPNLVLTIGYLIMEADEINVTDSAGRTLPGVTAGYDHVTGFGLVRLLAASRAQPVSLGASHDLALKDPVLAVQFGGVQAAQPAFVVSKRDFSGGWEYLLDEAIYTFPPISNWGGAGLFSRDGALVGVGSLFMRNADGEGMPGNMFVPTDLLKPILNELKSSGRTVAATSRPWLGITTDERPRGLTVTRVADEGPGDTAGVEAGDVIIGVNGKEIDSQAAFYRAVWARGKAGVVVTLDIRRDGKSLKLPVTSVDRITFMKPRTTL